MLIFIYLAIGAIVGFLSGLLGIGGGSVIVPSLYFTFVYAAVSHVSAMHDAVIASFGVMIICGVSAVIAHARRGRLRRHLYMRLVFGLLIGAALGVIFGHSMDPDVLKRLFAVLLFIVAVRLWLVREHHGQAPMPHPVVTNMIAVVVGALSGLLGIGGGVINVPWLSHYDIEIREVLAVSSLCNLTLALFSFLVSMSIVSHGFQSTPMELLHVVGLPVLCIAVMSILFAQVGVRLAYRLPVARIKQAFSVLLVFVALKLWF